METSGMSEESVDIHIRLSPDGARLLEDLMALGNYTSKSAYMEAMIFAIEDIFSAFYTDYELSKKASTSEEKLLVYSMFTQYLLAIVRRLGWASYRDNRDAMKKG
jgi:hypothetical protein